MKKKIFILISFLIANLHYAQTIISLEKENGIYKIPCKVNGIPMKFILDTGASNVSISATEAVFLIKQGLISEQDIIGSTNYMVANGEIKEGTNIKLKSIEIGGLILEDIVATVVNELNAPLLLGQSALSKLGAFTIDSDKLIFNEDNTITNFETEIVETNKWINELFSVYAIKNDSIDIKYEIIELRKMKLSGFSILLKVSEQKNNKPKNAIIIIELDKIISINFEENKDSEMISKLIIESDKDGVGFYLFAEDEQLYEISNCYIKLCCLDNNTKERLIKAFANIITNNDLFIKKTQKF